jgi:hypothetical protein
MSPYEIERDKLGPLHQQHRRSRPYKGMYMCDVHALYAPRDAAMRAGTFQSRATSRPEHRTPVGHDDPRRVLLWAQRPIFRCHLHTWPRLGSAPCSRVRQEPTRAWRVALIIGFAVGYGVREWVSRSRHRAERATCPWRTLGRDARPSPERRDHEAGTTGAQGFFGFPVATM